MSQSTSITLKAPLVASPNQAMRVIQVSRKKLYELINYGDADLPNVHAVQKGLKLIS